MTATDGRGFRFGLEAEFLLVDAETFRPLWHHDLTFEDVNQALEAIPIDDLPDLGGLELEPPHRTLMPYVVEGYHVPDPDFNPIDLLPKGVEIRTPISSSIEECLGWLLELFDRMRDSLIRHGYRAVVLSHHPIETHFEGPQNKRRYDFWQWAMQVMLTYGPDINVSLPPDLTARLDYRDLHAKVNHYAPALTALTLACPLYDGGLWEIRGRPGLSIRTYRRSTYGRVLEEHPEEDGRLELKPFEMTRRLDDFRNDFLLWLELLLDDELRGRASDQTRVYDLGQVARFGLEAQTVRERASAVLDRASVVLPRWGFDPGPLSSYHRRLETGRLPADEITDLLRREGSIPGVLRHLTDLIPLGAHLPIGETGERPDRVTPNRDPITDRARFA